MKTSYRLAPDLVITYLDGQPQLHIPSKRLRVKVDWKVISVISMFTTQSEKESAITDQLPKSVIDKITNRLIETNILVPVEDERSKKVSKLIKDWGDWGEAVWFLQLHSNNAPYEESLEGRIELAENFKKNAPPPPPIYTCHCSDHQLELLKPSGMNQKPLADALTLRRSCRNYTGEPITLQELSDLLFYTGAMLFVNATQYYGNVAKKTAPSPGGRHTIELYPVINTCEGVPSGIYHYCQKHHALSLLHQEGNVKPFLKDALYNQDYFLDASVTVIYTSVIDRLMWKYKSSRVYRLMHFETAHYAQNFLLAGTALGRGVFVTGAVKEKTVEEKLGIDGIHEVAMYVTGIGQQAPDGPYDRPDYQLNESIPNDLLLTLPRKHY